jgi:hypothetical protein
MNPVIHYVFHKKYYKDILCVKRNIPGNCCEGKCQLKKEIKVSEESPANNTAIPLPKIQNEIFSVCLVAEIGVINSISYIGLSNIHYITRFIEKIFISVITPPPRF